MTSSFEEGTVTMSNVPVETVQATAIVEWKEQLRHSTGPHVRHALLRRSPASKTIHQMHLAKTAADWKDTTVPVMVHLEERTCSFKIRYSNFQPQKLVCSSTFPESWSVRNMFVLNLMD